MPLAWSELLDLAADYGVPPVASETPRNFSARLRGAPALNTDDGGVPQGAASAGTASTGGADTGTIDAGRRAVTALTTDFERHQYGRPDAGQSEWNGALDQNAGNQTPAQQIALVRKALRRNAGLMARLRADWLPPSVMSRWGWIAGTPFRAVRGVAARVRRAVAGLWNKARDGVRRLREG